MSTATNEHEHEVEDEAGPRGTRRLTFTARLDWLAWVDAECRRSDRQRAGLFAAGLVAYAEREGLAPPPPRY